MSSVEFVTTMTSGLSNLVPPGVLFRLSAPERRLLEFSLRLFGEPLSRFLLSGTGEAPARLWRFDVTFTDARGSTHVRAIKVEPDDFPGEARRLPCRREPLAILALLRLRVEGRPGPFTGLSYRQEEVLDLLGWEDTAKARAEIDGAVKRYARLSYAWGLAKEELAERGLSFYDAEERFVSGYGHYDAQEGGEYRRVASRVDFSPEFVAELLGRKLFGVDWRRVGGVSREVSG